jgi:protein-S-isoprenylcysteine O-methyltransferase Ste14
VSTDPMFLPHLLPVLYWGWVVSEVVIAVATRTREGGGKVQDRGSQALLWVVIAGSASVAGWIGFTHAPNLPAPRGVVQGAAMVCLAAGLAIRLTAIFTLGRAFSANVAIREQQALRTNGMYAVVRHPSYLGLEIVFLGAGLYYGNWLSLAIMLVFPTAALLYRIHLEEAVLRGAFGEQYTAYSAQTKRLVPGVY